MALLVQDNSLYLFSKWLFVMYLLILEGSVLGRFCQYGMRRILALAVIKLLLYLSLEVQSTSGRPGRCAGSRDCFERYFTWL
jgi:hypothetical protein